MKRPPPVRKQSSKSGSTSPLKKKPSVTPKHSSRRDEGHAYADDSESIGEFDSPDDQDSITDDDMMKHAKLASIQNEYVGSESEEEEYGYSSKHSYRR